MTSPSPSCPRCKRTIPPEDFNVSTDLAFCRSCNRTHSLSELMEDSELAAHLNSPVTGTWKHAAPNGDLVLGASHRSLKNAIGSLVTALFWNGIVSIFVVFALANTLRLADISPPINLPEFKSEDGPMAAGMVIFLWCFLTPFIAIGTWLIISFLMSIAGKSEVTLSSGSAKIATGLGRFTWRQRFNPADVKRVKTRWEPGSNNHPAEMIVIELNNGKELKFGSALPRERKLYLAALLREATA